MWQNNGGFGANSPYQNNFNQENYPVSPFATQSVPGQQYFPQQANMDQFDENNSEGLQPEIGLFNNHAFMQNQYSGPQFSPTAVNLPPKASTPLVARPPTQINARAAELKAELLKRREGRASPATAPILTNPAMLLKQTAPVQGSSSLRGSPQTPTTMAEESEQEINLNELISQYSDSNPAADTTVKHEVKKSNPTVSSTQNPPKGQNLAAQSQALSTASPTNPNTPVKYAKQLENSTKGKSTGKRHASNGSVSEGEILEESSPATKPNEPQVGKKVTKNDEQGPHKYRDERSEKPASTRPAREESPPHRPLISNIPKPQNQRSRDDYCEEVDMRIERQPYQSDYKNEKKHNVEERQPHQRQDAREQDYRRPEPAHEPKREEPYRNQVREQKTPTLNDLLPLDEDLREWLEITGYHNVLYRSKILNRRRAIAALDAKREQLLAEMQTEERGGLPVPVGAQAPSSTMLPPPLPSQTGGRTDSVAAPTGSAPSDAQREGVSNKRPYSDVHSPREEMSGKIARTDDRPYQPHRIMEEDDFDGRRPRSSGFDASRRSPIARRGERETSRPRFEPRDRSRERDGSPSRRGYEGGYDSRPAPRSRAFDDGFYDREEAPERGARSFEVRGNYRGRAFDPQFRGRGRGRGRGDPRDSRDFRDHPDSMKPDSPFGQRIANSKPYKDPRGFDRGGRGGS